MPLIDRGTTVDGIQVPRSLFGDDKIKALIREGRTITQRANELMATIIRARFDDDQPDNEAVREAVRNLYRSAKDLWNLSDDLRLLTEVTAEGGTPVPPR